MDGWLHGVCDVAGGTGQLLVCVMTGGGHEAQAHIWATSQQGEHGGGVGWLAGSMRVVDLQSVRGNCLCVS
jgi:hypothetical protein